MNSVLWQNGEKNKPDIWIFGSPAYGFDQTRIFERPDKFIFGRPGTSILGQAPEPGNFVICRAADILIFGLGGLAPEARYRHQFGPWSKKLAIRGRRRRVPTWRKLCARPI